MGDFAVTDARDQVDLPVHAQRLVAFLALKRTRMSRSSVAGSLWGEWSQDRAAGNLRSALWRLRRRLDGLVEADGQTLRLAPHAVVDVDVVLEAGVRVFADGATNGQLDCDPLDFSQELLPGWDDDWVVVERERLRQWCLHTLEALVDRLIMLRQFGTAIQAALGAIKLDPLRESARRCAVRVHLAEGNYSEALRYVAEYSRELRRELGIRPSPQIGELLRSYDLDASRLIS